MGLKDKTSRCSERLISRHLSLRLGYTPAPELVRAQREKFRNINNSPISYISVTRPDSLYDDINLNRSDLSEFNQQNFSINKAANKMAEETRLSSIETDVTDLKDDVGTLKSDMISMNGKMDELLLAVSRLSTTEPAPTIPQSPTDREGAATPAQNQAQPLHNSNSNMTQGTSQQVTHGANSHPNNYHGAHQQGTQGANSQLNNSNAANQQQYRPRPARNLSHDEFIQREMDRDRFSYAEPGKNADINIIRSFNKPYMYVYRDGLSTLKQKLEARQAITAPEYIDATLSLLSDPRAFHPNDYIDIFDHLRKVSRDALERPWHAVRRWTQYIWDEVESGSIMWADRDLIQEERVRMCLTSVYATPNPTQQNTYQIPARRAQGMQEVTCRAYNTRNGCSHRESHVDGHVYALHICTYCDSLAKTCYHSVRECERRITHTRNDAHNGRNRMYGHNNHHPAQNSYNYQNHGQSKNGF